MTEDDHDLVYDLGQRKYWDISRTPNGYCRVETRMEYDKQTCERIINLILRALNGEDIKK